MPTKTVEQLLSEKFSSIREITFYTPDEQQMLLNYIKRIVDGLEIRGSCGFMSPRQWHDNLSVIEQAVSNLKAAENRG